MGMLKSLFVMLCGIYIVLALMLWWQQSSENAILGLQGNVFFIFHNGFWTFSIMSEPAFNPPCVIPYILCAIPILQKTKNVIN